MARALRFVYSGAIYDIMARGDGGKKLCLTAADHLLFLDWPPRLPLRVRYATEYLKLAKP